LKETSLPATRGEGDGEGEAPGGRAETDLDGEGVTLRGAVFVVEGVPVLVGVTLGLGLLDANSAPRAALTPQRSGFVYVTFREHPAASL
jgi:hypothetical protein